MIVERSAYCVEEATFSGRWLSSKPAAEGRGPGLCRSPSAHEGGGALGWAGSRGVAAGHGAPGACTLRSLPLWNFCPPVRQEGEGCQGARRTRAGPAGRRWACALSLRRGAGVWEDDGGGHLGGVALSQEPAVSSLCSF